MKKILFTALLATVAAFTQAQNTDAPMATLQHGEQTSVFFGKHAFKAAYEAAADSGDVITLSSGKFDGPANIFKSISVYGAGFEDDETTGTKATVVDPINLLHADKIDEDGNTIKEARKVNGCYFEGLSIRNYIYFRASEIKDITIAKCSFDDCHLSGAGNKINITIRQCVFGKLLGDNYNWSTIKNLLVTNSHFYEVNYFTSTSTGQIDHCIVTASISVPFLVTNSILCNRLPASATSKNNLFVGNVQVGDGVQDMNNNWTGVALAGVYAVDGEDGAYAGDKTFELKYPKKYVGTDGTEIGLHGGIYAWNKIPCLPRITESNIDTKTSADGKLKVSIKVQAQTKD
ncbi:MAG: hypothetical protein RRY07_05200 [Bacteroidaceae bacterium]